MNLRYKYIYNIKKSKFRLIELVEDDQKVYEPVYPAYTTPQ
jgi:hypothetical protein